MYLNDASIRGDVAKLLGETEGVAKVLEGDSRHAAGLDHERAGDLVAISEENAWFTYYYWMDDSKAPDFARCVDIHRKPGYDPVELFLDPKKPLVKLGILWRLLKKALGFRMLMDVIPLDASLVKGSHGAVPKSKGDWPVFISPAETGAALDSTDVHEQLYQIVSKE